jgi:hypothetical protein
MSRKGWISAVAGVACAALAVVAQSNVASAQTVEKPHRSYNMPHTPAHNANQTSPKQETVTLEIRGATSPEGARMLSSALTAHQVDASLQAMQGKPCRVTAMIDPQTDLGALGQAIRTTSTPDKAQSPPSLDLVVYGKFDKSTAKKAAEALSKIKGVDAKDSNADLTSGEFNIRVIGGAKVTANQIHRALQSAGVWTQFTRTTSDRRS